MLALIVAFQVSGEEQYLQEIDILLGFLENRLLIGDQILHHWMDGRAAAEPDPIFIVWGAMCRRSSSSTNWLFSKICTVFVQFVSKYRI